MVESPRTLSAARRPGRNVVILGASNVVRSLPTAVRIATSGLGTPLDLFLACGHGRSYGVSSSAFGRVLPAIRDCGLWRALPQSGHLDRAVITDVGNDILYDLSVSRIVDSVEQCLQQLSKLTAVPTVSALPTESIRRMGVTRYTLLRSILFPPCRLTLEQAIQRSEQLDRALVDLSIHYGARVIRPHLDWYGWDPIHIRRRHFVAAWNRLLAIELASTSIESRISHSARFRIRMARPELQRVLGIEWRVRQPALSLANRCTLHLY